MACFQDLQTTALLLRRLQAAGLLQQPRTISTTVPAATLPLPAPTAVTATLPAPTAVTATPPAVSTIYRTLKRLGLTRKKLRHISIRQCDQAREQFMTEMAYLDADMIVWLDETGNDQKSGRRNYGYHLRGMVPTSY